MCGTRTDNNVCLMKMLNHLSLPFPHSPSKTKKSYLAPCYEHVQQLYTLTWYILELLCLHVDIGGLLAL